VETVTRHDWISVAAYFIAESRNFAPGKALNDWLKAENAYCKMKIAEFIEIAEEDNTITITGLKQLAASIGVQNIEDLDQKIELIRAIQQQHHHRPCFRMISEHPCHDEDCQWKHECKKLIADWCCR